MNSFILDDLLEVTTTSETIEVEAEQIEQALQFSRETRNPQRQWLLYLQNLALSSFEKWLQKRQPDLLVQTESCSLFNPSQANFFDVICNLQVGSFKVCLIPTLSLSDPEIAIPRAVIELPEFAAHFYVVIGIEEELEIAAVRGFLQRDRVLQYRERIQPELDWNYLVEIAQFDDNLDELLLYLQCLEPSAIPLPDPVRAANLVRFKDRLESLLPQIQNKPLWQVLNWEQGVAVLTHPDLLNWIYRVQTETVSSPTNYLSDLLQILTQQATNVGRWIQSQWDEVAQELTWQMLSTPVPSPMMSATRSPTEELSDILAQIQRNSNLEIPPEAGFAYRDLEFNNGMRLYGITWSLPDEECWNLLLILGSIPGQTLSSQVQWRISDQTGILIEESLQPGNDSDYLFAQLIGADGDKFLLTLTSAMGDKLTLPPLAFSSSRN